jgi:hypothetical protein
MARKQRTSKDTKELFRDPSGQSHLFEKSYQEEQEARAKKEVECLGMTFENDEARRAYFLEKLKEKLKDPEFCKIEGFPIGSDENILVLSDPPYYTACPNPFIEDFIRCYGKPYDPGKDIYRREPYAADIEGSKATKLYMAHTYHTKVPPESIIPLIMHYMNPGEIFLDPFCGSGMAGVAVHFVNQKQKNRAPIKGIICDLSPFASFLSHKMVHSEDVARYRKAWKGLISELERSLSWLYKRKDGKEINYAIWSDVYICPECGYEQTDWELTVDEKSLKTKKGTCRGCNVELKRGRLERKQYTFMDPVLKIIRRQSQQVLCRIALKNGNRTKLIKPDKDDLSILSKADSSLDQLVIPSLPLPQGVNTQQPIRSHGFTHTHDFYTKRNILFIANYVARAKKSLLFHDLLFLLTSVLVKTASRLHAIGFGGSINLAGQAPNTLQVPSTAAERNLFSLLRTKADDLEIIYSYPKQPENVFISTNAAQNLLMLPDSSIDYIFTDPPFGGNINYSEVSFLYEVWLGSFTNPSTEAIVNSVQGKDVYDYENLMFEAMKECFRVLKPGRWISVEFHNSANSVWNAIQTALGKGGFVVAGVRMFDKGQGTWKQMTTAGAVNKDLIISAYKPDGGLASRFQLEAGTEEGLWDFIRTHLGQLPVFVSKDGQAEVIPERQNYLLFDRMVGFHVQHGVTVPLSAAEFYQRLAQRFPEREGMYFLSDQVAEYDKKRMTVKEMTQLELFVIDESSAIQWLRQQILKKPQTFQEIHPQFLKEISAWEKHEKTLELMELLEQNFLRYDGDGEVPSQIHRYLSSNFKELRNLAKDDPVLRAKAKDRWYVPDPNKAGDLEKLRERALLKEFDEYQESKQKQIKVFRLEAVRAGFKKAWQERDYKTIIEVARKIPENVLQEDPKLLMWYDQALTRTGGES